jgi:polar amino acid transport system substrate-binding protein
MKKNAFVVGMLLMGINCHASAACSRPIVVPITSIGRSVIVEGDNVSGVYPDALRELGAKAGCTFLFPLYPRARSDQMFFEGGTSDLIIPASFVPERSQKATFIPLIKVLPTMVTIKPLSQPMASVHQLLDAKELRGATVRGYTFGKEYQDMMAELEKAGRVDFTNDLLSIARMLLAGRVDFAIMPPHVLRALMDVAAAEKQTEVQLRSYPLEGLPRVETGVYISRRALSEADQTELRNLFNAGVKSDAFVKGHLKYYPTEILKGVVTRP